VVGQDVSIDLSTSVSDCVVCWIGCREHSPKLDNSSLTDRRIVSFKLCGGELKAASAAEGRILIRSRMKQSISQTGSLDNSRQKSSFPSIMSDEC
jgi:hypothetical protein